MSSRMFSGTPASTYELPVAPPSHSSDNQKYFQKLPNVPEEEGNRLS